MPSHPAWPKPIHNGVWVPTKEEREKARKAALQSTEKAVRSTRTLLPPGFELPEVAHNGVKVPTKEACAKARQSALVSKNTVRGTRAGHGVCLLADNGLERRARLTV